MTEKDKLLQGYKETPLGIIPQDWKVLRLGDLCHNTGEYGLNAPAIDYSKNMPTYLRITDIDENGKFRTEDIKSVNSPMAKEYYLKNGDIVFARTGATVGKTYLYNIQDGQLVYAGFLIKFSPNNKKLLSYYLKIYTETKMYWNWVTVASQRSGQPGINASEYCSFKMIVPPIEEQEKIVEVLSEWDKAIELQTKLIEKLELRKRAMMQRLLTGRVRLNGFSGKWQAKLLCELGTFEKGYGVPKEQIREKGHKALTYGEIYTQYDYVIKKFASFIDDATAEISKPISCGAILFAGSGETLEDIGKCIAYVDNDIAYAGGDIIVFNPNPNINSLVLSYYLNSPSTIIQKRRYGQGHSVVHIYTRDLAKIKVLLPSLAEQTAIAEVLISADKEIENEKQKLSSLRNQKRGLMQQLLTGKKRIMSSLRSV